MILRLPRYFMFPLATLAFAGVTVSYANIVFTATTRWIFLLLLMLVLVVKRRFMFGLLRSRFGLALLAYCGWCMMTASWSEVLLLSAAKATAFSLIAVTFVSAGQWWVRERGNLGAINYLAPVAVMVMLSTLGGGTAGGGTGQELQFSQGLTDNPNMFGSLICMALPFLLWHAYRYRTKPQIKWMWFALLAIAVGFLARSHSRSSILSAGMLGIGFCLSLKLRRTSFILVLIMGALLIAAAAGTAILETTYNDYVLKGSAAESGILFSRQKVWEKSYENAQEGGWCGAGYGVTVGETRFVAGFTAVGYGREKGNTQLAIVEETGVVGLGLYLILLLTLFTPLVSAHIREKTSDIKVALGIITGCLAGLTMMSVFEAWWVGPGSVESVYFWGLAGVGIGLAENSARASNSLSPSRIAQGQALYPARFPPQRSVKG